MVLFLFIVRFARYMISIIFAISLGWIDIPNRCIQALEPFISLPNNNTTINNIKEIMYKYGVIFSIKFIFIFEDIKRTI